MTRRRLASVLVAVAAIVVAVSVSGSLLAGGSGKPVSPLLRYMPTPDGDEGESVALLEGYWNDRVTYPTGRFNPDWVRRAAAQDDRVQSVRGRRRIVFSRLGASIASGKSGSAVASASTPAFTSLGPKPERMTGCGGCYDYSLTEGRINAMVADPMTTTNGSIVAYAATVGGGVWKTTNCCSSSTTWTVTTDDPLINTTSIDTLAIAPNDHNTIYAGTGDLNYGSFSMGSQGVLKSTDGGATWTVLGAGIFTAAYPEPAGQFPQYQAVGKIRVDPNNGNRVLAGTKTGLYLSYDGGASWTGPCLASTFASQRQDITALELNDDGTSTGTTRILAAVGTRGFASNVQYDLGSNGANGIYKATLPASGCPTFTSIAGNSNGFVFGNAVTGSPYATGANLNAGSGNPYVSATSGNQIGRIDLGVAPSNPNVIYAQAQSIAANSNSGCGNTNGCQLGAWVTTNGGTSWSFMAGSAGGALRNCTGGQGDYPQNWYDQGVAVDPNNPDRVFFDTFEVWFATRTGTSWLDLTCGYNGTSAANHVVHVDQHALAFLPGSSSILLIGSDGGAFGTTNATNATSSTRPTFFNMDSGLNTIEFYSGDISGNFATSSNPSAAGGAQDNAPSVAGFTGSPTGPVQWQTVVGGDGFYARIDPVGTGSSLRYWVGNNSGGLSRCTSNCLAGGSGYSTRTGGWSGDTQSFILPFDLFHGGIAGGDDCGPAGSTTGCGHLVAGTTRVWETVAGATGTNTWYVTNNPTTQNLTKGTLGNRSFINQVKYSPKFQSVAIAGTNDGNVQIGFNLGTGTQAQATWVNVTGGNAILPNRPVLGIALDPSAPAANVPVGYAAVGGFNANTPSTPGHVFQVSCAAGCASFAWADKTGNLPDMPVDSIIVNPRFPQQVFAGSDFGLYITDNINDAYPTWFRLNNGLPNMMLWDLQIDRGSTTLSLWTRGRGAYVAPLPNERIVKLDQTITFAPLAGKTYGDADFDVSASASSGLAVSFAAAGSCTISAATVHIVGAGSCTVTASQGGDKNYNPAPIVSRAFTIAKADQTISVSTTDDRTFGDPDFELDATATSNLVVTLAVDSGPCTLSSSTSPATVHITGAGTCVIRASQAGDANFNAAPDEVRSFNVNKANQSIDFGPLADKTFGDADFEVSATATSHLDVTFTATGTCDVSGTTVHITGGGECTITASQAGNADYNPAPDVSQTFTIAPAAQSIAFGPLADKTYGDPDFSVNATASSGLPVTFAASGECTVAGATVHITGAGSCTITASQAGNADYNAAADVSRSFAIDTASQTIAFDPIADKTFGDPDFPIQASASSGLPVYFVATGSCSVDSATSPANVHLTHAGSCTITASQTGDSNFDPAPDVARTFSIAKSPQAISFAPLPDKVYGDPDFDVVATVPSGLPVSFTAAGNCTISGTTVHITGGGSCTITASQGGNDDYLAAPDVARTFAIGKEPQTITFAPLADKIYGDPNFTVSATASSGLPVSFTASGSCTVSGTTVHITTVGYCTVTASQAGNANWQPAPPVDRTFNVAWPFRGFFQPVDNDVVNVGQAGTAIPVKFALGAAYGLAIFADGYPQSVRQDCVTGASEDAIETTVTAGQSTLTYDATSGQYIYVWKTDKAWAGTCRKLTVKLFDNTVRTASFRFK
jgi:hypothetical protein